MLVTLRSSSTPPDPHETVNLLNPICDAAWTLYAPLGNVRAETSQRVNTGR